MLTTVVNPRKNRPSPASDVPMTFSKKFSFEGSCVAGETRSAAGVIRNVVLSISWVSVIASCLTRASILADVGSVRR